MYNYIFGLILVLLLLSCEYVEAFITNGFQNRSTRSSKLNAKSKPIRWIACTSTKEVTKAVEEFIEKGDYVAELGSQLRETSIAICNAVGPEGKVVLADIERKFPSSKRNEERTSAMRREGDEFSFYLDRARFFVMKSFDYWREIFFFCQGNSNERPKYDAFVVDVSSVAGNDLGLTCISLIKEFIALNQGPCSENSCRCIIVKSGSLHHLAQRLVHAQRLFSGVETLDLNQGNTAIIGTVGVEEYRRTIPFVVRKGDDVVELGSHFGTSTALLHESAHDSNDKTGGCIGVDVGPSIINAARNRFPHILFSVGDAWKTAEILRKKKQLMPHSSGSFDCVYVDVGGLSGSDGLLEAISLITAISNSMEPRAIVIKSLCVRRLASSLVPYSELQRKSKS
jgi:ubiquinone/menaquinone biosynthesis C-methylase UbiE